MLFKKFNGILNKKLQRLCIFHKIFVLAPAMFDMAAESSTRLDNFPKVSNTKQQLKLKLKLKLKMCATLPLSYTPPQSTLWQLKKIVACL